MDLGSSICLKDDSESADGYLLGIGSGSEMLFDACGPDYDSDSQQNAPAPPPPPRSTVYNSDGPQLAVTSCRQDFCVTDDSLWGLNDSLGGEVMEYLPHYTEDEPAIIQSEDLREDSVTNDSDLAVEKDDSLPKPPEEKPFSCDLCQRKFNKQSNLKRHMLTHSEVRIHVCDICGRKYALKNDLTRHLVTHSDNKPYPCHLCPKKFCKRYDLNRHLMSHSKDRAFSCSQCPRQFNKNSDLKRHIMIHTGERKFACEVCGRKFKERYQLKRHSLIHSREDGSSFNNEPASIKTQA